MLNTYTERSSLQERLHVATLYLPAAKVTHTHTQSEWAQPSGPSDTSQGMKGILFESLLSFAGCHREFKLSGSFPQKYPQLFHLSFVHMIDTLFSNRFLSILSPCGHFISSSKSLKGSISACKMSASQENMHFILSPPLRPVCKTDL